MWRAFSKREGKPRRGPDAAAVTGGLRKAPGRVAFEFRACECLSAPLSAFPFGADFAGRWRGLGRALCKSPARTESACTLHLRGQPSSGVGFCRSLLFARCCGEHSGSDFVSLRRIIVLLFSTTISYICKRFKERLQLPLAEVVVISVDEVRSCGSDFNGGGKRRATFLILEISPPLSEESRASLPFSINHLHNFFGELLVHILNAFKKLSC